MDDCITLCLGESKLLQPFEKSGNNLGTFKVQNWGISYPLSSFWDYFATRWQCGQFDFCGQNSI